MLFAGLHRSNLIGGWRGGGWSEGETMELYKRRYSNSFKRRALSKDICKAGLKKKFYKGLG